MVTLGAVCLPQVRPERLRRVVRAADEAGLDELWLWEDCFWASGIATTAAVLSWTERLRVGVGLLPVQRRDFHSGQGDVAPAVPGPGDRGGGSRRTGVDGAGGGAGRLADDAAVRTSQGTARLAAG